MEVLSEVPVTFSDTKGSINEKLEEKFARENVSVEEVT